MKDIFTVSDGHEERIIAHRRKIHAIAEVGFDTEMTLEYISGELTRLGYEPRRCGRGGLIADIGSGRPHTLLRADIDALPMTEESGEPFAAENGNMHACGHDMNTAMLLGAAEIISQNRDKIKGRIRFAFQSAEELLAGATAMIEDGLLENPSVDRAFMLHTLVGGEIPSGRVVFPGRGVATAASDFFRFTVQGRAGHGAEPSKARDAVFVAGKILSGIYELPARELSLSEPCTLSVGKITGGVAANAIAERAELYGSLRTYDDSVRKRMLGRIEELGQGIGLLYSTEVSFERTGGCPSLICDPQLTDRAAKLLGELLCEDMIRTPDGTLGGGSEDFSYISMRVPSLMVLISAGSAAEGYTSPLHNPRCRFSEKILTKGAQIYAALAGL